MPPGNWPGCRCSAIPGCWQARCSATSTTSRRLPPDRRPCSTSCMDAAQIFTALLEPAGRADPYPLYAALHELGEAVALPDVVIVHGYDAISSVLRDPAFGVSDTARYDELYPDWQQHPSLVMESLLSLTPPQHARIRGLMAGA